MSNTPERPDASIADEGSLYLFHLNTPAAQDWVEEFVSHDRQFFGDALVVEHRFVGALVGAIAADGLLVEALR